MYNRIFQENIEENIISNNITQYTLATDNPIIIHIPDEHINDDVYNNLDDECLICLEKINIGDQTWTCTQCNQVFHLDCKQSWEIISTDKIFKCPHCKCETNSNQQSLEITSSNQINIDKFEVCNLYFCCKTLTYMIISIIYLFCSLFILYVLFYNLATYDYNFNTTDIN